MKFPLLKTRNWRHTYNMFPPANSGLLSPAPLTNLNLLFQLYHCGILFTINQLAKHLWSALLSGCKLYVATEKRYYILGSEMVYFLHENSNKMLSITAPGLQIMSLTLTKYLLSMPCPMVLLRKNLFLDVNDEQLIQHWLRWQEL